MILWGKGPSALRHPRSVICSNETKLIPLPQIKYLPYSDTRQNCKFDEYFKNAQQLFHKCAQFRFRSVSKIRTECLMFDLTQNTLKLKNLKYKTQHSNTFNYHTTPRHGNLQKEIFSLNLLFSSYIIIYCHFVEIFISTKCYYS